MSDSWPAGTVTILFAAAPEPPDWVSASVPGRLRSVATVLAGAADELRQAASTVRGLLADAAGVLGWRSDAATATAARAEQTGSRLSEAAARIDDAATAVLNLAHELDWRHFDIETLQRRRRAAVQDAAHPLTQILSPAPVAMVNAIDRELRTHIDALAAADRAVADRLAVVVGVLHSLAQVSGHDGWVTSLAVPEVFAVLARYDVLPASGDPGGVDWAQLQGSALLRQVLNIPFPAWQPDTGEVQRLLRALPATATNQDRAQVVAAWFEQLTALQQVWYTQKAPEVIGNLDGVPFGARDQANRVRLEAARKDLSSTYAALLAGMSRTADGSVPAIPDVLSSDRFATVLEQIKAVDAIELVMGRPDRHLLTFDLTQLHPRAVVAIGDVDTAANIAVFTPGLTTTVKGNLAKYDLGMYEMKRVAIQRAFNAGVPDTVAAVTWIGYDAPQWGESFNPERSVGLPFQARTGGRALNGFLAGITADRPDDPHITALGHSYGSLTTSFALQEGHDGVDDVVVFGSPGLGTDDIRDLNVPAGHAFALEARLDPVADLSVIDHFGSDPSQMKGVIDLSTAPVRTDDGVQRTESVFHSAYLQPNSTSEYNIAVVVAGLPQQAVTGRHFGIGDALNYPGTTLAQWFR